MLNDLYVLDVFLRVSAPAKINLHLEVLGLRPDCFHELAMVMQSIDLADQLEMTNREDGVISLSCDNSSLSINDENLIVRAAKLLKLRFGVKELGAKIHLQKRIPVGAGLAGGSSDAAATLVGLNKLWRLELSNNQLEGLASELGSDIPFCLAGGTQLCFGRGEHLEPICNSILPMAAVLLVKDPKVSVPTPWAYGLFKERNQKDYLKTELEFEKRRQHLRSEQWLKTFSDTNPPPLRNDLQQVVAPLTPSIENALRILSEFPGTLGVAMSGSGPSCFALYPDMRGAKKAFQQNHMKLATEGFDSWCCSFLAEGVKVFL